MCCNLRTLSCDSVLCFLVAASSSSLPSCQPGPAQHSWVNAVWAGSLLCDPLTSLTSSFSTQCLYFSVVLRVLAACSNLQKPKLLKTAGSKDPDAACCHFCRECLLGFWGEMLAVGSLLHLPVLSVKLCVC